MAYELPRLNYSYGALQPYFDAKTMEIHHTKHHQAYIDKANAALAETPKLAHLPVTQLLSHLNTHASNPEIPDDILTALRNNAGGHANHSFFWEILSPQAKPDILRSPVGALGEKIYQTYQSFDDFKTAFKNAAISRFGSGWVWLCVKTSDKKLCICSTPNQDSPLMEGIVDCPGSPVIGLDVWEHAYYLNYQNRRPDYIDAFWNVVNWYQAEENYKAALC